MKLNRRQASGLIATLWGTAVPTASFAQASGSKNWITRAAGAKIHSFSTEYGAGWVADNLVPSNEQLKADGRPIHDLIWSSGASVPFPHWVVIDLGQARWLTQFVFNNALSEEADHPGISARHLVLLVGNQPDKLQKVASFELEKNKDGQAVSIEPTEARYIKFLITSNWGHPWYTELGASMVLDDGRRPGDLSAELLKKKRLDLYGIYFDFNSANLRAESDPTLAQLAKFCKQNPSQKLVIEGHTDAVGSDGANITLSQKRAESVVADLVKRGIPKTQLTPIGFGAKNPVASNATELGRARNRRVTASLP